MQQIQSAVAWVKHGPQGSFALEMRGNDVHGSGSFVVLLWDDGQCSTFAAEGKHTMPELSSSCCSSHRLLQYQENPHCQELSFAVFQTHFHLKSKGNTAPIQYMQVQIAALPQ